MKTKDGMEFGSVAAKKKLKEKFLLNKKFKLDPFDLERASYFVTRKNLLAFC
jgi:hypothetical protein